MQRLLVATGFALLIAGCSSESAVSLSKAKQLHTQMVCTLPQGLHEHTPILELAPSDSQSEKLAREYIELQRRRPISDGEWDLAATFFYTEQSELRGLKAIMQHDAEKVGTWLRNYESGMELFKVPIDGIVEKQLEIYKKNCESYTKANKRYSEMTVALEELRRETKQSWLDPKKRLPCPVQQKPGCKA